ncbi:MAG TPA: formyltransferase family protein [Polyangiaceae bacterium]
MTTSPTPGFTIACFGLPLAPYLLARDGHAVTLAVLSPVRAPGRRRLARQIGAERILDASELGRKLDETVERELRARAPLLIVSWFWTRRLPERWLALARGGGIGAHPSLLPKYRGPDPYYAAIDAGESESGITIHRLTPRYDDGEILLTRALSIDGRDAWQLARALDRPSLALLREAVRRLSRGELAGTAQDEQEASWAPAPEDDALRVDWRWPTERVLRRIRALAPVPGLTLEVEGLDVLITRARPAATFPEALEHGEGAVVGDPPVFVVRTGDGAVAVERGLVEHVGEHADTVLSAPEFARAVREHLTGRRARLAEK